MASFIFFGSDQVWGRGRFWLTRPWRDVKIGLIEKRDVSEYEANKVIRCPESLAEANKMPIVDIPMKR
jgi:hypothetical protein